MPHQQLVNKRGAGGDGKSAAERVEREGMEQQHQAEAARNAKESLDMAFQMSNILDTGLDRHSLSLLVALCDRGVNPESLAALVREFSPPAPAATATTPAAGSPVTSAATTANKESYFHRLRTQP